MTKFEKIREVLSTLVSKGVFEDEFAAVQMTEDALQALNEIEYNISSACKANHLDDMSCFIRYARD